MALTDPINAVIATPSDTLLIDGRAIADTPQGAWVSYGVQIGKVPSNPATTVVANIATAAQEVITWNLPNVDVAAGMYVQGVGIPADTTVKATPAPTSISCDLSNNLPVGGVAAGAILTFTYGTVNTIKVKTIDNIDIIIENPVENELLPLQVAQVFATDTVNVSSITAYENQS
tara:strand:- start:80 stop:601 length:522 start_codon:yes stop_codon:yes gene_type:complete